MLNLYYDLDHYYDNDPYHDIAVNLILKIQTILHGNQNFSLYPHLGRFKKITRGESRKKTINTRLHS